MKRFVLTTVVAYLPKLFLLVSLAYPIFVFSIFPQWAIDDAFINFRYAENLANHGELTWNIGEAPIEGYTGLLLQVVLAGGIQAGFDPVLTSHVLGISSFFLGWLLLFLTLRGIAIRDMAVGLTLVLYGTTPMLFTHATSGLETMLFIAALLLSLHCFFRFLSGRGRGFGLSIALLLTSLVRPEGVAFSAVIFLTALCFQYRYRRAELNAFVVLFVGVYFLPALLYFLWRLNYYGAFFPNTFYAKRGDWNLNVFLDIIRFLRRSLTVPLFAAAFLIISQADFLWEKIKQGATEVWDKRVPYLFGSCAVFSLILLLFLSQSHLTTNFSTRFYIPFLPFIFLFLGYLFHIGMYSLERTKSERLLVYKCTVLAFFVLFLYQTSFHIWKLKGEIVFARGEQAAKESQHYAAGKYLKEILRPEEWLVVYLDAGAPSYFSKMKVVDFGALNDPFLARHQVGIPERVDYFYEKNPAALFFTSTAQDKVTYTEESDAITSDPRFQKYVLAKLYPSPLNWEIKYHQLLFLRKDIYENLPSELKP